MTQTVTLAQEAETRALLSFGRRRGWDVAVLGRAPLPTAPVHLKEWVIVPAHLDTSPLPPRALARVQALYAGGLRPQGFVVVHEAPKLLPAPAQPLSGATLTLPQPGRYPWLKPALRAAATGLGFLAVGVIVITGLVVLAAAALALAAVLAIPALLVATAAAAALDPILVAVMADGTWVEIDRWDVDVTPGARSASDA